MDKPANNIPIYVSPSPTTPQLKDNTETLKSEISKENMGKYMSKPDIKLAKLSFLVFGVTGVLIWSFLLNSNYSIFTTVYNYPGGADTVLIGYFALGLIGNVFRVKIGSMSTKIFNGALILNAACCLILPLCVFFVKGTWGIIFLNLIISLIGLAIGTILANGFAYGSLTPISFSGYSVVGNGMSGLFGFLIWQVLTKAFFDVNDLRQIKWAITISFGIIFLEMLLCLYLFNLIKNKPWFYYPLKQYQDSVKISLTNEKVKEYLKKKHQNNNEPNELVGTRSALTITKVAIVPLLVGNGAFFVSFLIFPNISPYAWNGLSLDMVSFLVGIYMIFDSLGRYIPNIGKSIQLSEKMLLTVSLLRFLYLPLAIYFAQRNNSITNNLALQIIIMTSLAFSHGFTTSQGLSSAPSYVLTSAEKGILGFCIFIVMQIFLVVSMALSKLLKIILEM